jgi:hypothetical protein
MKVLSLVVFLGMLSSQAFAANCKMKLSTNMGWAGGTQVLNEIDLGSVPGAGGNNSQNHCTNKCNEKVAQLKQNSMTAYGTDACSKGLSNGTKIYGVARAGIMGSSVCSQLGTVNRVAPTYSCPEGSTLGAGLKCRSVPVISCPNGYWTEGQGAAAKCVKQVVQAQTLPGVSAWNPIGNGSLDGKQGQYRTDDVGGVRFFIAASLSCASGFTLVQASGVPGMPGYQAPAAGPVCEKPATQTSPGSCSLQ